MKYFEFYYDLWSQMWFMIYDDSYYIIVDLQKCQTPQIQLTVARLLVVKLLWDLPVDLFTN